MSELDPLARVLLSELCQKFPVGREIGLHWKRYRTTAGTANYRHFVISLSPIVITDEEKLRSTLIHEYAHLLAYARAGRKGAGHGPAWQQAMRDLGAEPRVTHSYPVQRNQSRQVVEYRCVKCGFSFEKKRRFPKRRKYIHRDCGGLIQFVQIRAEISESEVA